MKLRDLLDYPALLRTLRNPGDFLAARRAGIPGVDCDLELRNGLKIRLRGGTRDFHVFHRIFIRDEYRLAQLRGLRLPCVLDIGAHIGLFALRLASQCGRIFCFEPARINRELLIRNARASGLEGKLAISGKAVHSTAAPLRLRMRSDPYDFSAAAGGECLAEEIVQSTTLEEIFAEHAIERCDLLKLDCEGSEYDILLGAPHALLQRCERIILEYHVLDAPTAAGSCARPEDLKARLAQSGLKICERKPPGNPRKGYLFCHR